jgi:ankyrin repeat protein
MPKNMTYHSLLSVSHAVMPGLL